MRPPVSKIGRWVTLETPGLKPIHKQEYKYGYNPYFSRMTQTQRRRWIRQQAALHQEFGNRDHYSSRSTTDSDSMEVITRAEASEYLRGPYARKKEITGATTKNIATSIINGTSHKLQNTNTHVKARIRQELKIITNTWRKTVRMLSQKQSLRKPKLHEYQ